MKDLALLPLYRCPTILYLSLLPCCSLEPLPLLRLQGGEGGRDGEASRGHDPTPG